MHLFFTSLVLALALWLSIGTVLRAAANLMTQRPQNTGLWGGLACVVWALFYYLSR